MSNKKENTQKINEKAKREFYEREKHNLPQELIDDIEKYGLENFELEILDEAFSPKELDEKRKAYIKKFQTLEPKGYNKPDDLK